MAGSNEELRARLRIIATDYQPGSILRKTIEDAIAALAPAPAQEEGREAVYPMQPLALDSQGVLRFRKNTLVRHLLDNGGLTMNDLALVDCPQEEREQFAQLIGYSLYGFGTLSYVSDATYERAAASAPEDDHPAPPSSGEDYPEAAEVCGEAYQVVGSLLDDLGAFDSERGQKILDNLSQHRMVHRDVLPWPSLAPAQEPAGGGADAEIQAYREFHLAVDSALLGADALQIDHEGDYRAAIANTIFSIRRLATPTPQAAGVSDEMVEAAMDADAVEYGASIPASRVRRILSAALTAAGAAPEGWVWVPREPTPEMLAKVAGIKYRRVMAAATKGADGAGVLNAIREEWAAMLSAAEHKHDLVHNVETGVVTCWGCDYRSAATPTGSAEVEALQAEVARAREMNRALADDLCAAEAEAARLQEDADHKSAWRAYVDAFVGPEALKELRHRFDAAMQPRQEDSHE